MTEVATSSAETMKSSPEVTKETVQKEAELLASGKRNLLCGEVTTAVNQLQEACRLLAAKHGDLDDKCGEAYLCYGSALLELSRMESGVLGNALQGIEGEVAASPESKTEESEQKIVEDVGSTDDTIEDPDKCTDDAEENEECGMDEDGDAQEETEEADQDIDNDDEDKKDEEDVSNLQLAWEILELAKVIYSKQDTKEMKLKAAEAYLKLGEVGLETEQYEQAIGDLRECLKLQQAHLEPESRLIAETHYQIGLACLFNSQHDDALIELRHAVKSIETKIGKLEEIIKAADEETKGKEPASMDNPIVQAQKEVKDLREILPDILAKIDDTEDEKRNQDRVKQLVKENVAADLGTTTTFGEAKSSSDVKDISVVMVRKKRKPEDEMADDSKKAKTESGAGDASNGTAEVATNGTTA